MQAIITLRSMPFTQVHAPAQHQCKMLTPKSVMDCGKQSRGEALCPGGRMLTSWLLVQAGQETERHPAPPTVTDGDHFPQSQSPASLPPACLLRPAGPQTVTQTHPHGCLQSAGLPSPGDPCHLGLSSLCVSWQHFGRGRWWVVMGAAAGDWGGTAEGRWLRVAGRVRRQQRACGLLCIHKANSDKCL